MAMNDSNRNGRCVTEINICVKFYTNMKFIAIHPIVSKFVPILAFFDLIGYLRKKTNEKCKIKNY